MQLHVTLNDGDPDLEPLEMTISSFTDQDKFANRVARSVKQFIRSVPIRKSPSRLDIGVYAWWDESAPHVERKKKRGKKAAAEASDAG